MAGSEYHFQTTYKQKFLNGYCHIGVLDVWLLSKPSLNSIKINLGYDKAVVWNTLWLNLARMMELKKNYDKLFEPLII